MKHRILKIKKYLVCRKIDMEIQKHLLTRKNFNYVMSKEDLDLGFEQTMILSLMFNAFYPSKKMIYHKLQRRRQIIKSLNSK